MAEQLLTSVRVLDLTWHIAGPYCTKMLADYGADVIKIERPDGGDPARNMGPFLNDDPHPEKSLLFSHLNLNKKGITLNLKSATGKKILTDLVKDVDILVESFSPGTMARLGLDYETLEGINPRLVMTAISNFGQDGPYRDLKASELVLHGLGKAQYTHGMDGRPPLKYAGNAAQFQCGLIASVATLASYWLASTIGVGQYIDCSMQQMLSGDIDCKTIDMVKWAYEGRTAYGREDPRSVVSSIFPSGVYPCQDGYVRASVGLAIWPRFLRLMQNPELDRLEMPAGFYDLNNKPMFDVIWYSWCMERTKQQIMEEAQALGVHISAIKTPREVIDDPHFKSRGYWVEVEHPVSGKQIYPGAPADVPDAPWAVRSPAPLLGQHNEEVYCGQLGYPKEDLARLKAAGAI